MRRYRAYGKTLDGQPAVALCEAEDFADAKTTFRQGRYQGYCCARVPWISAIVVIDLRTTKEIPDAVIPPA